jgi:hypothetical protein
MSIATTLLVLRVLDGLLLAARVGRAWRDRNRAVLSKVRVMIAEGREPTLEEFAELDAESAALTAELERIYTDKAAQGAPQ